MSTQYRPAISQVVSPSKKPEITTIKENHTSTLTKTPTPSSTSSPNPIETIKLTWTPLPTLHKNRGLELVRQLMSNNINCILPCWWGMIAGQSLWNEALQYLSTFDNGVVERAIVTKGGNEIESPYQYYDINFDMINETGNIDERSIGILVSDNIIVGIDVGSELTNNYYPLNRILAQSGSPEKVLIYAISQAPSIKLPYYLVLYYPKKGMLVYFNLRASKQGEYLLACPPYISPNIRLDSPGHELTDEQIEQMVIGDDPRVEIFGEEPKRRLLLLEEVTSMSIESFYLTYLNPDSMICIKTDSNNWP